MDYKIQEIQKSDLEVMIQIDSLQVKLTSPLCIA